MHIQNSILQTYSNQLGEVNQKNNDINFRSELTRATEAKNINEPDSSSKPADLTHMTPMEMREWLNDQIISGKMTVHESTPFVGMTIGAETNNVPVNYLEKIQVGIDAAIWRGDHNGKAMWEIALNLAQKYQSTYFSVNIYA